MHIWHLKCKSFHGPKAGPGPRPMFWARFARTMPQHTIGNFRQKFLAPPPTKSWIRYCIVWKFAVQYPEVCEEFRTSVK